MSLVLDTISIQHIGEEIEFIIEMAGGQTKNLMLYGQIKTAWENRDQPQLSIFLGMFARELKVINSDISIHLAQLVDRLQNSILETIEIDWIRIGDMKKATEVAIKFKNVINPFCLLYTSPSPRD